MQDRGPEKGRKRAGKGPEKGAERGGRAAGGRPGGPQNAKRSVKREEKSEPEKGPEKSRRGSTGMRGSGQARRNARGQRKALLAGTLPDLPKLDGAQHSGKMPPYLWAGGCAVL